MKKSISILTIMFLIMSIFIGTVDAATVSVSVSNSNPEVDSNITATIYFSEPVGTASLNLNFNNQVLQYVSSTAWQSRNNGSSIKLDYIDSTWSNKTITSMQVTFKVIKEGTSSLSVSNMTLSNAAAEELPASSGGSATVTAKIVEPEPQPEPDKETTQNSGANQNSQPSSSSSISSSNKQTSNNNQQVADNNSNNNQVTLNEVVENTIVENEIVENIVENEVDNQISNDILNNDLEEEQKNGLDYPIFITIGAVILAIIVAIIMVKNKN